MKKRINLISGPRNISTALMYSFGNRKDFTVVDEPLYAYYLKYTGKDHPGREEILKSYNTDPEDVIRNIFYNEYNTPYVFLKNMAHHLVGLNRGFLKHFHHLFLIRDPKSLICSFAKVIPNPTLLDIGLKEEFELLAYMEKQQIPFTVLDSNELLNDAEIILKKMCDSMEIPFSSEMLQWPSGPKAEDGVWAKYWYKSVHNSKNFQPQKSTEHIIPKHLEPLLEEAQPYYLELYKHALKI